MTTEQAVQGRADLVATASLDGVALSATGLEEVGTLLRVAYRSGLAVVLFRRCLEMPVLDGSGITLMTGWRHNTPWHHLQSHIHVR